MSAANTCINCTRTEQEVPILSLKFRGNQVGICSSCLPVLIHKPQQLADRLSGAEEIQPARHEHD